jgi:hypothetical protein
MVRVFTPFYFESALPRSGSNEALRHKKAAALSDRRHIAKMIAFNT